ncbi:MAG: phage major capsid protein [bacterium]|nr:phage major capsid protein [bacterium]
MIVTEERYATLPETLHQAARIALHEGMYAEAAQRGVDFTHYLETLDPSPTGAGLDAFERQLALAGIQINGETADVVDRFFATQESAVLFPEYVSRTVRLGIEEFGKLKKILASRVKIDDNTYKSIYMDETVLSPDEKSLAIVSEGAALPRIDIKTAEHTITIKKYGRYLQASYEAIRRKRINVISLFLRAVGVQMQRDKFADAVAVLIDGDGNTNPSASQNTAMRDEIAYADLVTFVLSFDPYKANVLLCDQTTASILLNVSEVKQPAISEEFQTRGDTVRLFGAELVVDPSVPPGKILGLDRRFALQEIYETGLVTESDRLIRRQVEGTAVSEICGYAKVITAACKVLNLNW